MDAPLRIEIYMSGVAVNIVMNCWAISNEATDIFLHPMLSIKKNLIGSQNSWINQE